MKTIKEVILEVANSRGIPMYSNGTTVEFLEECLSRVDAERGKEAVGMVVDDFDGWTKVRMFKNQPSGTRLFLSQVPTIPEGIVLFGRTLDGNTILPPGSNKEGIALYSILDFAQGERK